MRECDTDARATIAGIVLMDEWLHLARCEGIRRFARAGILALVVLAAATPSIAAERIVSFNGVVVIIPPADVESAGVLAPEMLTGTRTAGVRRVLPPGLPAGASPNANFVENGMYVEAFWAINIGTPNGVFIAGHFHPRDLSLGFEGQHYGARGELHGLYIRAVDGTPFGLKRMRYRVTRNRELVGRNVSIEGFSLFNVKILVSTHFTPIGTVLGQFIQFPVGPAVGNDDTLPWGELEISGFDYVTQLFITSSASVDFDDLVFEVHE